MIQDDKKKVDGFSQHDPPLAADYFSVAEEGATLVFPTGYLENFSKTDLQF